MKKKDDDFIKYIKRWLKIHYSEFTYKPYIVRELKNIKYITKYPSIEPYSVQDFENTRYILKFSSIPNITVYIEANGKFDMWAVIKYKKNEFVDNPLDLTTVIKKDHKGYYCSLCTKRTYYKNKEKIWENHLKELLSWSKENLQKGNKFLIEIYDKKNILFHAMTIVPECFDINTVNLEPTGKHLMFPIIG